MIKEDIRKIIENSSVDLAVDQIYDLFNKKLPSDIEIEQFAEDTYKEDKKMFPIYNEYEFVQGYIQGAMRIRNIFV
jgi:hypothetical protein